MSDPGPAAPLWELWGPPLDPPTAGGLPRDLAEQIAAEYFDCDNHLALAMLWEAYAAMLPTEPAVTAVTTGVQSVRYDSPGTAFGQAMARAQWHRSLAGNFSTVPLHVPRVPRRVPGWWRWWEVEPVES